MPAEAKLLFRPDALRPRLQTFTLSAAVAETRARLAHWADLLGSNKAEALKETELLPDFLRDIFGGVLGYVGPAGGADAYNLKREALIQVEGKFADGALGRFSLTGVEAQYVAAVEGKGPRDPLDRPFAGRKLSAVDQALRYAVNFPCDWYIVTNLRETRLYHRWKGCPSPKPMTKYEPESKPPYSEALRLPWSARVAVPPSSTGCASNTPSPSRR